jgi:outer membrane protein OmpA-like peptidoglycan-associated protein
MKLLISLSILLVAAFAQAKDVAVYDVCRTDTKFASTNDHLCAWAVNSPIEISEYVACAYPEFRASNRSCVSIEADLPKLPIQGGLYWPVNFKFMTEQNESDFLNFLNTSFSNLSQWCKTHRSVDRIVCAQYANRTNLVALIEPTAANASQFTIRVDFSSGEREVSPESRESILSQIANEIRTFKRQINNSSSADLTITDITITSETDIRGLAALNLEISQQRAASIRSATLESLQSLEISYAGAVINATGLGEENWSSDSCQSVVQVCSLNYYHQPKNRIYDTRPKSFLMKMIASAFNILIPQSQAYDLFDVMINPTVIITEPIQRMQEAAEVRKWEREQKKWEKENAAAIAAQARKNEADRKAWSKKAAAEEKAWRKRAQANPSNDEQIIQQLYGDESHFVPLKKASRVRRQQQAQPEQRQCTQTQWDEECLAKQRSSVIQISIAANAGPRQWISTKREAPLDVAVPVIVEVKPVEKVEPAAAIAEPIIEVAPLTTLPANNETVILPAPKKLKLRAYGRPVGENLKAN